MRSAGRAEAEKQVSGYPGCRHQGFISLEDAENAWRRALASDAVGPPLSTAPFANDAVGPPSLSAPALSDEEAYWVVIVGERPGVYRGKYVFSLTVIVSFLEICS
jgi:hypothetical protein